MRWITRVRKVRDEGIKRIVRKVSIGLPRHVATVRKRGGRHASQMTYEYHCHAENSERMIRETVLSPA